MIGRSLQQVELSGPRLGDAEEPPAPDSPLARVLAFAAEHGEDAVTEERIELAKQGRL
ncbi:hypothetical protein [Streptomyces sp. NPDC051286]|uniref:hypothetical protein n=1 Tax=Streptomyces sp. NPDC051286 TaxID=3365647 RepID=UPI00379C6A3C